jgi:hypothetical protein
MIKLLPKAEQFCSFLWCSINPRIIDAVSQHFDLIGQELETGIVSRAKLLLQKHHENLKNTQIIAHLSNNPINQIRVSTKMLGRWICFRTPGKTDETENLPKRRVSSHLKAECGVGNYRRKRGESFSIQQGVSKGLSSPRISGLPEVRIAILNGAICIAIRTIRFPHCHSDRTPEFQNERRIGSHCHPAGSTNLSYGELRSGSPFYILRVFSPVNAGFPDSPPVPNPQCLVPVADFSATFLRLLSILRRVKPLFFAIGHLPIWQCEPRFPKTPEPKPQFILSGYQSSLKANFYH